MIKPTSFIGFIVSKIAKSYKPKHVLVRLVLSFIFATSLLATTSLSSAYANTAITRFFSDISSTLVSKVYAYNYDYWDDSSYISFEGTPGSFWSTTKPIRKFCA
jgi:hypothetical protein